MAKTILSITLFIVSSFLSSAFAYDNKVTHRTLTKKAVEHSKLSPENGDYLYKNYGLGFSKDIHTIINGKEVAEWVQEGSDYEDDGPDTNLCRASNHCHIPLKSRPQA